MASKQLSRAAQVIETFFDYSNKQVFKRSELSQILIENLPLWNLSKRTSTKTFLDFLQDHMNFEEVLLVFPLRKEHRYIKKGTSPLDIALSLKAGSYLTNHTAATLHGIAKTKPNIYVNKEQPNTQPNGGCTIPLISDN